MYVCVTCVSFICVNICVGYVHVEVGVYMWMYMHMNDGGEGVMSDVSFCLFNLV